MDWLRYVFPVLFLRAFFCLFLVLFSKPGSDQLYCNNEIANPELLRSLIVYM